MKRPRDLEKYRRAQRARQRRKAANLALSLRKERAIARGRPLSGIKIKKRRGGYFETVTAPPTLSFLVNPNATSAFIRKLQTQLSNRRSTFVSLRQVTTMGYDAVVVLIAILFRFKSQKVRFAGNPPLDLQARRALEQSGFLECLFRRDIPDQDSYEVSHGKAIYTHANRSVESPKSADVIARAATAIWGEPRWCPGVQRVLLELMVNTNNHADPKTLGTKHWWLSVHLLPHSQRAIFVFVDLGIGVLASLDEKPPESALAGLWKELKVRMGSTSNTELLKGILNGQLRRTSTGEPYRGKGLPSLKEVMRRNGITDLRIVTNDVMAKAETDEYTQLTIPFRGTLVCWEVNHQNESKEIK